MAMICLAGCSTSGLLHQTATTSFPRITSTFTGAFSGASLPRGTHQCKSQCPLTFSIDVLNPPINYPDRDTSLTDPWARAISYHFLNQTDRDNFFSNDSAHGAGQLWSQVPLIPSWQQHSVPFPIIQADSRPVGSNLTTALSPTSVVYEVRHSFTERTPNYSCAPDNSHGVGLLGPTTFRHDEHVLCGHASDQRTARQRYRLCHQL